MAATFLTSSLAPQQGNLHGYYLPRGLVSLTIKKRTQAESSVFLLEVGEVEIAPDPKQRYVFSYAPGWFRHDDVTVEFHENGLLKSVGTVIDDQTGAFLEQAITLGSSLTKILARPGDPTGTRSAEGPVETVLFEGKVDPFDEEGDMAGLTELLKQAHPGLELRAKVLTEETRTDTSESSGMAGIYCRPPAPCELNLMVGEVSQSRAILTLPHPKVLHFVAIPQAPWVKTQFSIAFGAMGYPVKIALNKPSSALEFIKFPVSLLKAILEIPASLFKFRVDLEGNRQAAAQQLFDVEQKMVKLQEEMVKAQATQAEAVAAVRAEVQQTGSVRGPQGGSGGSNPAPGNQGAAVYPADVVQSLRKLEQDVEILRKRMNKDQDVES
ncbi:MAG: hypothetical protein D6722_17555 [Bacteroidetes bacterium]|nr:MAG: hypothetical protein D6722_17555 [Bacteroidota bacterium]